ncbi:hypothetical protein VNO78_12181 [Psophocarpus tetragonolobus]|uniref:Uncharacterized protein n=1 Tax=Psophocarpus tetragonolobus TaxID=3891 RepID=A0AAN9SVE1_PSOTE
MCINFVAFYLACMMSVLAWVEMGVQIIGALRTLLVGKLVYEVVSVFVQFGPWVLVWVNGLWLDACLKLLDLSTILGGKLVYDVYVLVQFIWFLGEGSLFRWVFKMIGELSTILAGKLVSDVYLFVLFGSRVLAWVNNDLLLDGCSNCWS